jgi:hypothetical protein
MVSVLRTLQSEWNALVPQAVALNIRRVRTLGNGRADFVGWPLETIEYRRTKLEWLRGEIARLSGMAGPFTLAEAMSTSSLTAPGSVVVDSVDLSGLTFGVEFEFILPTDHNHHSMAQRLRNNTGIECHSEGYGHSTGSYWKIVTDGSLGNYAKGAELVSPILRGEDGLRQVERMCDVLKAAGCKVSKKCGLHVHVGAADWTAATFRNLVSLYAAAEPAIDTFMAPSRRGANGGNGFCRALRINRNSLAQARTVDDVARAIGQMPGRAYARHGGRYHKVNMQSFWQHGTVEFRHHQGTVEADKSLHWIRLCLRMAVTAQDALWGSATASFDELFEFVRSPENEKSFFKGRAEFFATQLSRATARTERASRPTAAWLAVQADMNAARRVQTEMQERDRINAAIAAAGSLSVAEQYEELARRNADPSNPFTLQGDDLVSRSTTAGQR